MKLPITTASIAECEQELLSCSEAESLLGYQHVEQLQPRPTWQATVGVVAGHASLQDTVLSLRTTTLCSFSLRQACRDVTFTGFWSCRLATNKAEHSLALLAMSQVAV